MALLEETPPSERQARLSYTVNIMVSDALATPGARLLAAIVLIYSSWNIPVYRPDMLNAVRFICHGLTRPWCAVNMSVP